LYSLLFENRAPKRILVPQRERARKEQDGEHYITNNLIICALPKILLS
jgi:hypothetical protein